MPKYRVYLETTDDLTAALDQIKAELRTSGATYADEARLLGAVEKVLEMADEWDVADPGHPCAAMIREAITGALAKGEGAGDG